MDSNRREQDVSPKRSAGRFVSAILIGFVATMLPPSLGKPVVLLKTQNSKLKSYNSFSLYPNS